MLSFRTKKPDLKEICEIAEQSISTDRVILQPGTRASEVIGNAIGGNIGKHIKNRGIAGSYIDAVKWSAEVFIPPIFLMSLNPLMASVGLTAFLSDLLIKKNKEIKNKKETEKMAAMMEQLILKQEKKIKELEEKISKYEEQQRKKKFWKRSEDAVLTKMEDKLYECKSIVSAMAKVVGVNK